ncbi:serpin family protein [Streptomyces sp. MS1.AVA.1]|uniref:Serpin family protein n=1 Tax=Streptomyces machairae TaxID=3134109 RepID=A0ABU8UPZ8_9ACTN
MAAARLPGGRAGGPARTELADAVGLPADEAAGAARELLGAMRAMRGLDSALGLWTKRTLELRERWEAGLPAEAHGVLTGNVEADKAALDAWAVKRTGGLIEKMPVRLDVDTEMVVASALALRTEWLRRFRDWPTTPEAGPGVTVRIWACTAGARCWTGSGSRTRRRVTSPS